MGATLPAPTSSSLDTTIDADDLEALRQARSDLDRTSFVARLTGLIGQQVERFTKLLPAPVTTTVAQATDTALQAALRVALASLRGSGSLDEHRSRRLHQVAAVASGAAGGLFGVMGLAVELPVSTTIMLRSIADIARRNGEDMSDPETVLNCLQVFGLGSRSASDEGGSNGYFAARSLLATTITDAVRHLASRTVVDEGAPILLRFLSQVGTRFGTIVSQKVAAQSIPIIGAAGGATVNYAFTAHVQAIARGHFTIRRLERRYGPARVRAAYAALDREEEVAA